MLIGGSVLNSCLVFSVDSFVISAGERYDFVLNASQAISSYWIRLHGLMDCNVNRVFQAAILRYQGAPDNEPSDILTYENTNRQGKVTTVNNSLKNCTLRHVKCLIKA